MNGEKEDRLKKFFPDGRTMIVPIDHGTALPVGELDDVGGMIEALNPFADGYVVNMGVAKAFGDRMEGKGVCLRTDVYKPPVEGAPDHGSVLAYTVDDALETGADAVMNMFYLHHANEAAMVRDCAELVSGGLQTEIPVIVESLPFGIGKPDEYTVENIGFAVRVAAELGADVVKTAYPTGGSVDDFKRIVESCFVPVVVLGGAAMGDDAGLLGMAAEAMAAGASGIAIGRNVWQHPNPPAIARALHAIVHEEADAEAARKLILD